MCVRRDQGVVPKSADGAAGGLLQRMHQHDTIVSALSFSFTARDSPLSVRRRGWTMRASWRCISALLMRMLLKAARGRGILMCVRRAQEPVLQSADDANSGLLQRMHQHDTIVSAPSFSLSLHDPPLSVRRRGWTMRASWRCLSALLRMMLLKTARG